ncbi:hypothetical protein FHG64_16035 [Antarcticibacterium flavum]|uniref:Uncharacterized protein n=1 Tax=Antarcticibacterium flavum TaxID=2058175 RepID=A0A5B7X7R3_9FLAO|nr:MULTISPECIES: hypothetical protein [Antarcticibacterium]MCM4161873.1 hypothetical protein [Antarcticibacterium sp. W02-3]QCY70778.1 hypothetical protein FHG64_16035 [Antarcticibacterium flavum]
MTGYKFKFIIKTDQGIDVHNYTSPVYSGIDNTLNPMWNNLKNQEAWAPAIEHWNNKIKEIGPLGYSELRLYKVVDEVETLFAYGGMISTKHFREVHNLGGVERLAVW